ncbi:MAG: flavodoxin [Lachnospiraceae bacterium]|nr:flavodoxin [Lachnospiraceae bacterium]
MGKVLVAFFSASGVTKALAERLASAVGADIFEIVPETLYTDADLNWRNSKSRSSVEMDDRNSRPAIASKLDNMDQYGTVFVGFPIWWYREPSIIDTFMEAYDFTGKTVVPFATSGISPMGESSSNLQKLAPGARVAEGKRFGRKASTEELKAWAEAAMR